jgi:hypothetical protein
MLTGSIWELMLPLAILAGIGVLYLINPSIRTNRAARGVLLVSALVLAFEVTITVFVFGLFVLSGGMANF